MTAQTQPIAYPALVTAATIGLTSKPLTIDSLAGSADRYADALDDRDSAAALLDAAALFNAARRGGAVLVPGVVPAGSEPDPTPELSAVAAAILTVAARTDQLLLRDLLGATAAAGFRASAPLLPMLLDLAARDAGVRPAVTRVLGERGRWLAGHQPAWRQVVGSDPSAVDPDEWQNGLRAERLTYFSALRDRDPAAARDLLVASWNDMPGEEREELLGCCGQKLTIDDEPLLETALDDRRASVRLVAARLLSRLPASAFGSRATLRASGVLRIERRGLRRRLVVTVPDEFDADAVRDGLEPHPRGTVGVGVWRLTQVLAAAPLTSWTDLFDVDADDLAGLPVADDLAAAVHAGWRTAAVRQGDPTWARALLRTLGATTDAQPAERWAAEARLATILTPADRVTRLRWLLDQADADRPLGSELAGCPAPWPEPIAEALLRRLGGALGRARVITADDGSVLSGAGRSLPTEGSRDWAAELDQLAEAAPPGSRWPAALGRAADVVRSRRRFHEELR